MKERKRQQAGRPLGGWGLMVAAGTVTAAFVLAVLGSATYVRAADVTVVPLAPTANAQVAGVIDVRARVEGLASNQYEGFWAVDGGSWNRMQSQNGDTMSSRLDVSSWNWRLDGQYELSFIALNKDGWKPTSTTIRLQVVPNGSAGLNSPTGLNVLNILQGAARPTLQTVDQGRPSNLFSDTDSDLAQAANQYVRSHPEAGAKLNRLTKQPMVAWYGNWNTNVGADINRFVTAATAARALPTLALYNIPNRDCGGYSAGGSQDAAAYTNWVRTAAGAIGHRPAMVIVEPDGLAGLDCLSDSDKRERQSLIAQTVAILHDQTDAAIYIDAGNPQWHTPEAMAERLKAGGIAQADGFALNMSNYYTTDDNIAYGSKLSKLVSDKHFIVDTSRNGSGPAADSAWCNPAGRTIGRTPTLQTGQPLVDAYVWGNGPGGSDGTCGPSINGSQPPKAGTWWPERALELLRNTDW